MPPIRQRQQGSILLIMVAVVVVLAIAILVSMLGELTAGVGKKLSATDETLSRIQVALVSFVSTHQRLPCPADPTGGANPGWPDGVQPLTSPSNSTCLYPGGVVPWNALGLSQQQVIDVWGQLISYRVYDGVVGLTQDKGATAINCDTDNGPTPNVEPTTAGLCNNVGGLHNTLRGHFITYATFGITPSFDKGLNVHDFGPSPTAANVPNVAYVLISHGPSGRGGYTSVGTRVPLPATDARDYANTQASPSFFIRQAASDAGVANGTTGHYDDIVSYLKIADLLTLAKQDARDWPEEKTPSFDSGTTSNMTSASTDVAAPHFMSTGGGIAGQSFTPDATGTTIGAGLAAGSYSICTWWPSKLTLVSGTTRKALNSYVEFAATDNTSDSFPGLTLGYLAGTSSVSTTGTGSTGATTISVGSVSGISVGMTVLGTGIATGATVTGVSGTTVSLSPANTAIVSGSITFGAPTNITCGTNLAATVTATGAAGQTDLVVSSTTGIAVGMNVFGNGIPFNATVSSIPVAGVGGTVRISQNMLNDVAGSVNFATSRQIRRDMGWDGGTLASYTDRFAVEFDANPDTSTGGTPSVANAFDPSTPFSRPHLAVDFGGVKHGTDASSCTSTAPGTGCDSEMLPFDQVAKTATGSAGLYVITITDAAGMYGIVHGMTVTDSGGVIPGGTTVTAISGNLVTLSQALTGSPATVTFSSLSTRNLMQNGLTVFHGARTEIYPKDCYAPTAVGTAAASTVTVTDASQLQSGMSAYGSGIGVGATVGTSFKVNLSTPNSAAFTGPATFTDGVSTIATNATGLAGQNSITASSVAGIVAGMTVADSGGAIPVGTTVTDILVSLSAANSAAVNGTIFFGGATAISTTGTGTSGSMSVTVGSTTGIAAGMTAVGTGLGTGAKVASVNTTTLVVVLTVANSSAVSGTLKFLPENTLVKAWTLSNSGCNLDSALCSAMKNVSAKLTYPGSSGVSTSATGASGSTNIGVSSATGIALGMAVSGSGIFTGAYVTGISGTTITLSNANTAAVSGIVSFDNRQILHTVSCVPAATVVEAYDSLYFGLTTASRTTGDAVSTGGSGSLGSNQITVTSTTGVLVGMAVRGIGIGNGATVSSIDSPTTLTLSTSNLDNVSGTVSFAGADNVRFRALSVGTMTLP